MIDDGRLVAVDGRPALRFERRYRQPVERVWRAVTAPDEMARWFPSNVEGERAVGAALVFDDSAQRAADEEAGEPTRAEGEIFRGHVVVHDPPNVFSFTWGGELLRFELHPDGEGTLLVFTHLLAHRSIAHRTGAGWHSCLGELDRMLGEDVAPEGDWMAVFEEFVDRLGPELAVLDGDALVWERYSHVTPVEVRSALGRPEDWGGAAHADEAIRWEVVPDEHGSIVRLRHEGIGGDAELAATWHAILVQLDMYLAAGQLLPVDGARFRAAYTSLLSAPA